VKALLDLPNGPERPWLTLNVRKMKTVELEKPFRLTRDFWIAFGVLAIPALCLTKPWTWALPGISRAAGLIFLPFAAAIVCYCPFLFGRAITQGSSQGKKIGLAFLAASVGAALFLTLVWKLYGFEAVPSRFAIPTVLIANAVFASYQATATSGQEQR
jgi:hypothetical protein